MERPTTSERRVLALAAESIPPRLLTLTMGIVHEAHALATLHAEVHDPRRPLFADEWTDPLDADLCADCGLTAPRCTCLDLAPASSAPFVIGGAPEGVEWRLVGIVRPGRTVPANDRREVA